jgi:hypothetical protein
MSTGEMPATEEHLVDLLSRHADLLWSSPVVSREVRSPSGGWADLGVLSRGRVYSVEAKLTHWRRALGQAALNRYWSDRAYIALWHSQVTADVLEEARQLGLGVIAIRPDTARVVAGARQGKPKADLKRRMVRKLQEAQEANR